MPFPTDDLVTSSVHEPLSAQDASFLFFERRATHMHVAALAIFEVGPLRAARGGVDAARLARYGESQLGTLPRCRQKPRQPPGVFGGDRTCQHKVETSASLPSRHDSSARRARTVALNATT
jgi:hypothetical protein